VAAANGIFEFRRTYSVMAGNGVWATVGWRKRFQRVIGRNAPLQAKDGGGGGGEVQKDCIMFALRRGG